LVSTKANSAIVCFVAHSRHLLMPLQYPPELLRGQLQAVSRQGSAPVLLSWQGLRLCHGGRWEWFCDGLGLCCWY